MEDERLDKKTKNKILNAQKSEITEYHIYSRLSESIDDEENSKILQKIGNEEKEHYDFWSNYTGEEVSPSKLKIWFYVLLSKLFGITFGIKLMESGEEDAQITYEKISHRVPEADAIIEDEESHEDKLIDMINEDRLKYVGAIVRGLNDALVELSGALAGLTFVLRTTNLIAFTGLITGISASLSMGGSEYLGSKSETGIKDPFKAAIYTGVAYIVTVIFLIFPYFIMANVYSALLFMLVNVVVVIFIFTFYISVSKGISFKKRFLEMAGISLGIAALSFVIGYLIRTQFGVEV